MGRGSLAQGSEDGSPRAARSPYLVIVQPIHFLSEASFMGSLTHLLTHSLLLGICNGRFDQIQSFRSEKQSWLHKVASAEVEGQA